MGTIGVSLAVPGGTGVGAASNVTNMSGRKTVLVSGLTVGGQIIVEVAAQAGGPFCQLRTFTAPKAEVFEVACSEMRVRSQNVAGAPVVDVSAEEGVVESVNLAVPAGNGAGAASDITALGELMTAVVQAYGSGSCIIELSEDGVNWVQAFSTFTPAGGCQTKVKPANFARVVRAGVIGGAAPVVQLAAIADAGGGVAVAEPRTCFVFRPGGVAIENVYTDWATLVAAMATVEGCKEILFDDSLAACQIPAGAWDMAGVTWSGGGPGAAADVTFLAGSTVTNLAHIKDNLTLLSTAGAPSVLLVNGDRLRFEHGGGARGTVNAILDVAAGATATIELGDECAIVSTGSAPINVNAGATCAVLLEQPQAALGNDVFTGAGDASAFVRTSGALVNNDQSTLGGTFTLENEYAQNDFIFRPGGQARGNIYTDWAVMFDAIGSMEGEKRVFLDASVGAITIPAGTWDLTDVTIIGLGNAGELGKSDPALAGLWVPVQVDIAEGASLTSSKPGQGPLAGATIQKYRFVNVELRKPAATVIVPIQFSGAATIGLLEMINSKMNLAPFPVNRIVNITGPISEIFIVLENSQWNDNTSATADLHMILRSGSVLANPGNITGGAGDTLTIDIDGSACDVSSAASFAAWAGTVTILNNTLDRWTVDVETGGTPQPAVRGTLHRVDASGGDFVFNLPTSRPQFVGQKVALKKTDGGANNVIANPAGADTIQGADRTATAFGYIELVDNGDGTWSTGPVV